MQKTRFSTLQQAVSLRNISALVITLKASAIAVAVTALYYQDLSMIFNDALQNESTNYVLIIPFLFAYFLYRKRKMLRAVVQLEAENPLKNTSHLAMTGGALTCATAVILYWYGSYTFTPLEYHVLTLPIFATGLTLILFNWQTLRQLAFPIAFLFFLTPIPEQTLYSVGSTLSITSSEISNTLVNALGVQSAISSSGPSPTIIITRPDKSLLGFTLGTACSGIYLLMGFLIFAAFTAYIIRDKPWKKAAIFLIGLPLIYLLNVLRITIILLLGYHFGEQLALQTFHLLGGFTLIILGTLLLLTIAEKLFKTQIFSKRQQTQPCINCQSLESKHENYCSHCGRLLKYPKIALRKADIAKIAAIAATVILLVSIQAPVFALTQGPAQIIIQTPKGEQGNTQILPQVEGYTLSFFFRDKTFEKSAKQDASLLYVYKPLNQTKKTVSVAVEIARTHSSLHEWEVCIITWPQTAGYPPEATQLDLRDTQILQNPPIIARYFAFQDINYNYTQLVLYWFETATFTTNGTAEQKHVKISLITYPDTEQNLTEAENQLLPFAKAIASYWQPIKEWSQIALLISQNGWILAIISTALLILIIVFSTASKIARKRRHCKVFEKLPATSQKIIEAAHQTGRTTTATVNTIAQTYQSVTGKSIHITELLQELTNAERIGLVKRYVTNRKDEPQLAWKTCFNLVSRAS